MKRARILSSLVALIVVCATAPAFAADETAVAKNDAEQPAAPPSIQTDQPAAISLSSKVPFKFYGFISGEFMWTGSQLSSGGTLDNTPANYNRGMGGYNRVVDEAVEGNNDAAINATVQNTRFGFLLEPYDFNGKNFSVDARLEMDFFSASNMSASSVVPRIRRAYAGIGQQNWRVLVGQEWEVFSPLNTATLNIGGNLWTQGNMGFRRPQIRFTAKHAIGETSGIEGAGSVNLPGNSLSFADSGNTTCVPMLEGRMGFWHKMSAGDFWVYLSGVYARHNNAAAGGAKINNWGIALSLDAPLHRFLKLMGEAHYGYSLGSLLSLSSDTTRQRTFATWGQIKSEWLPWLETNVGYGIDSLSSPQVAVNFVQRNQTAFANIMFKPYKVFVIGLEYDYLRTTYKGTGASEANAVLTNVLFYF